MNINTKKILWFVLLLTFCMQSWIFSTGNYLAFDDYTNISHSMQNMENFFTWFPSSQYNDRPFRFIQYKVMYDVFGDSYSLWYLISVLNHIFNVWLAYKISEKLFKYFIKEYAECFSLISALIFGLYPNSLMAVQWLSALNDLTCATFVLLSIYCFLKARENSQYYVYYSFLSIIFYWISLRNKEMSLLLPFVLLLMNIVIQYTEKKKKCTGMLLLSNLFMLIYALILFGADSSSIATSIEYSKSFNPVDIFQTTLKYIALYFDPFTADMVFVEFTSTSYVVIVLFLSSLIFAIYRMLKRRDYLLIMLAFGAILLLAPVLPMHNSQHRLYLYIPSIFIGLYISGLLANLISKKKVSRYLPSVVIIVAFGIASLHYTDGYSQFKAWWISHCQTERMEYEELYKIGDIAKNSNFYVIDETEGYNFLFYGPGNAIKVFYYDNSINVNIVEEFPNDLVKPYVLLHYTSEGLNVIEKDLTQVSQAKIDEIYTEQGSLDIAITGNYNYDDLEVRINGESIPFIKGKDFISLTIPEYVYNTSKTFSVTLYSELSGGETLDYIVELDE